MSGLACIVDGERRDAAGRSYPLTAAEIAALERGPWSARSAASFALAAGPRPTVRALKRTGRAIWVDDIA
jgi:hypothetical protein